VPKLLQGVPTIKGVDEVMAVNFMLPSPFAFPDIWEDL